MAEQKIINSFFENSAADYIFWYTGKSNVIGLPHPDHVFQNSIGYTYTRLALIRYNTTGKVYINEKMRCILASKLESQIDPQLVFTDNSTINIALEAIIDDGAISGQNISCVIDFGKSVKSFDENTIIITKDQYDDIDGARNNGIGIWVKSQNKQYVLLNKDSSLSAESCPVNQESYASEYITTWLGDVATVTDVNATNSKSLLLSRKICDVSMPMVELASTVETLKSTVDALPEYTQNIVVYDATYQPSTVNLEEIVKPVSIRGDLSVNKIIAIDAINGGFKVTKAGRYMLQLKQGFYLNSGDSDIDLYVYKNRQLLTDMNISSRLTSEEGHSNRHDTTSLSYIVDLSPSDIITLKSKWSNITDLDAENATTLAITILKYL